MSVPFERPGPLLTKPSAPRAFHVMAKPTGATCNLDCDYCFFLSKEMLYPGSRFDAGSLRCSRSLRLGNGRCVSDSQADSQADREADSQADREAVCRPVYGCDPGA